MEEPNHNPPISSSSSTQVQEEEENQQQEEEQDAEEEEQQHEQHQGGGVAFLSNTGVSELAPPGVDAWSCFVVLVIFWFFASMTLIIGIYESSDLQLGPYYSILLQTNSFFVREIKVQELTGLEHGMMLYGFHEPPPLDVQITWSENFEASLLPTSHQEWVYFLNEGSEVEITYDIHSSSSPLSLAIAEGKESFVQWLEDPSYPNLTLSWNIINGKGTVRQEIFSSAYYYVAVGNLNPEEIEVKLRLTIQSLVYNTTNAYSKCSLVHGTCVMNLCFMGTDVAVLTSPFRRQDTPIYDWYVKLSYEPRWISYFVGSGAMTILIVLAFKLCVKFQSSSPSGSQAEEWVSERAPLLRNKDEDLLSWGSSYDSASHDEDDLEDSVAVTSLEAIKDGDNNNPRRVCVICFDALRNSFFLPCGHCAACFTCGTRIVGEDGACPICRRKIKKVRKIIAV